MVRSSAAPGAWEPGENPGLTRSGKRDRQGMRPLGRPGKALGWGDLESEDQPTLSQLKAVRNKAYITLPFSSAVLMKGQEKPLRQNCLNDSGTALGWSPKAGICALSELQTIPSSRARNAAVTRDDTPSFDEALDRRAFTVDSAINSSLAISELDFPLATSDSTSFSPALSSTIGKASSEGNNSSITSSDMIRNPIIAKRIPCTI